MKTITKFMTLCAIVVCSVTASAQTYISTFPHTEDFEDITKTAFTGGAIVSGNEVINVFSAHSGTEPGIALFDGNTEEDGAQAITLGETDLFTIEYTSYFGWLDKGKTGTFSVKNSEGAELVSYGYTTGSCNITTVKIGGKEVITEAFTAQCDFNGNKGANGLVNKNNTQYYKSDINYNTTVTITINHLGATINFSNVNKGLDKTFSAAFEAGIKLDLASLNLGNEIPNEDRAPAIDDMTISKSVAQSAKYTIVNMCGEETISTEELNGIVGSSIIYNGKDLFVNDKKYIYVSNDSEGKTIASDGSTVVTVTYQEAPKYNYTVKASNGSVLAEGSAFKGDIINYSYSKYLTDANGKVTHKCSDDIKTFSATQEITEDLELVIPYEEYIGNAYFIEMENIANTASANNSKLSGGCAVRAFGTIDVFTVPIDGEYTLEYGSHTNNSNHSSYFVLTCESDTVWKSEDIKHSINYYTVRTDENISLTKGHTLKLTPVGSDGAITTNPFMDYMLFVLTKNTPTTDIKAEQPADDNYYDLSGRKVANPVKGNIYINGGKLIRY